MSSGTTAVKRDYQMSLNSFYLDKLAQEMVAVAVAYNEMRVGEAINITKTEEGYRFNVQGATRCH